MERYELKRYITYPQYLIMRQRAKAVMQTDPYATADGDYLITNVYFDDMYDTGYFEKTDGVARRSKFRMRAYNNDPSYIVMECKAKQADRIEKTQCRLTVEQADAILAGDTDVLAGYDSLLCRDITARMKGRGLRPVVGVRYRREAYIYPVCNVRITFDMELHASNDLRVVNQENGCPVFMDNRGIMEVKYDDFIPQHLTSLFQNDAPKMAMSKYVLCRQRLNGKIE